MNAGGVDIVFSINHPFKAGMSFQMNHFSEITFANGSKQINDFETTLDNISRGISKGEIYVWEEFGGSTIYEVLGENYVQVTYYDENGKEKESLSELSSGLFYLEPDAFVVDGIEYNKFENITGGKDYFEQNYTYVEKPNFYIVHQNFTIYGDIMIEMTNRTTYYYNEIRLSEIHYNMSTGMIQYFKTEYNPYNDEEISYFVNGYVFDSYDKYWYLHADFNSNSETSGKGSISNSDNLPVNIEFFIFSYITYFLVKKVIVQKKLEFSTTRFTK